MGRGLSELRINIAEEEMMLGLGLMQVEVSWLMMTVLWRGLYFIPDELGPWSTWL